MLPKKVSNRPSFKDQSKEENFVQKNLDYNPVPKFCDSYLFDLAILLKDKFEVIAKLDVGHEVMLLEIPGKGV